MTNIIKLGDFQKEIIKIYLTCPTCECQTFKISSLLRYYCTECFEEVLPKIIEE